LEDQGADGAAPMERHRAKRKSFAKLAVVCKRLSFQRSGLEAIGARGVGRLSD
jgi:hypothetical protein